MSYKKGYSKLGGRRTSEGNLTAEETTYFEKKKEFLNTVFGCRSVKRQFEIWDLIIIYQL